MDAEFKYTLLMAEKSEPTEYCFMKIINQEKN